MKLVGGKDFYDGVTGFGYDSDERRVFVRTNFNKATPRATDRKYHATFQGMSFTAYKANTPSYRYRSVESNLLGFKIIFCGRVYPGVLMREKLVNPDDPFISSTKYHTFWSTDALQNELDRQELFLPEASHVAWRANLTVNVENVDQYFEPFDVNQADLETLIKENIVHSIFVPGESRHDSDYWYDNTDGLKQFGFAKVVDPWQAYQQIDMWLGSQLAKEEDNMVRLSDQELITKHGFDAVSFRNTHHVGKPRGQK